VWARAHGDAWSITAGQRRREEGRGACGQVHDAAVRVLQSGCPLTSGSVAEVLMLAAAWVPSAWRPVAAADACSAAGSGGGWLAGWPTAAAGAAGSDLACPWRAGEQH